MPLTGLTDAPASPDSTAVAAHGAADATIRRWLEANAPNIIPVGRNRMHRYSNADHSMLAAMPAVENFVRATPAHDVWAGNVDEDDHEQGPGDRDHPSTGRDAPLLPRLAR